MPLFRKVILAALSQLVPEHNIELCFHLVSAGEITRLNEQFLRHAGATDVIAFNHGEGTNRSLLTGEIFICVEQAVLQARTYRTSWPAEVVRYAVHGTLHLLGYDDVTAAKRRTMKRQEDRLMRRLSLDFDLGKLTRQSESIL